MIEFTETTLTVERTLELAASPERVWRALTDPEELASWFPDRVDQSAFGPGAEGAFIWESHGAFAFRVEAAEMPLVEGVSTTVEWLLEAREDGGTTLRLCESGFVREEDREGNARGWDAELAERVELLAD